MALKKVRRPVLHGEKEFSEKKGWNNVTESNNEFEETNIDLQEEWDSPILSNQPLFHNTDLEIDANTINEDETEYEPKNVQGELALNRLISFMEDSVRMPRKPKVEQGKYSFRIDNITSKENIAGKFGRYDQFLIAFSLYRIGVDVPIQITIPYIISSKVDSPFMLFLASFKSIFKGQNINITQLVGLKGNCEVSYYETATGDIYERLLIKNVE